MPIHLHVLNVYYDLAAGKLKERMGISSVWILSIPFSHGCHSPLSSAIFDNYKNCMYKTYSCCWERLEAGRGHQPKLLKQAQKGLKVTHVYTALSLSRVLAVPLNFSK